MARQAEIILAVTPNVGSLEQQLNRIADGFGARIQQGINAAGGRGGAGGTGGGGGGGSSDQRARLAADMEQARALKDIREQGRVRTEQIALGKEAATQAYVTEQMHIATNARLSADASQKRIAYLREESRYMDRLGKLRNAHEIAGLRYADDPARRAALQSRIQQAMVVEQSRQAEAARRSGQQGTFWGQFMGGFDRAGGFGSALATIIKYGAAYKAVDLALQALTLPLRATNEMLKDGARNWLDYEQQMADASRTMREFGLARTTIKDALGRDALQFMMDYNVSLKDAATAQYELGSANLRASETLATYQVPLKVNYALIGDITQTTRLMTQMYKIHGEQMGDNMTSQEKMIRLGGILLKTWELEQVELSDIAQSYKYIAGNATTLKLAAEELIPTIGFLSTYGMRGSIGGTGLNQFFMQTAKNVQLTEDQVIKLTKATRGLEHTFNLGIKAGDLQSPIQVLTQLAKAVAAMPDNLAGRMQIAGIFGDVFNIRGARPAALLSDLERLGELLQNVAEVQNMTTAEHERYIESMVELRMNNPNEQLKMTQNIVYSLGTTFWQATVGADNLVNAIKSLNSWLRDLKPAAETAGGILHIIGGGFAGAARGWAQGRQNWFDEGGISQFVAGVSGGIRGFVTGSNQAADRELQASGARALRDSYLGMLESGMSAQNAREFLMSVWVGNNRITKSKFESVISQVDDEEMAKTLRNAMGAMNGMPQPSYEATPTGGSKSPASVKTPQEKADEEARKWMQTWQDKLTLEMIQPQEVIAKLGQIMGAQGIWGDVSLSSRASAKGMIDRLTQDAKQKADKERQESMAAAQRQKVIGDWMQDYNLQPYTDAIKRHDDALGLLDEQEKLYGRTIGLNSAKIQEYGRQELALLRTREVQEANLETATTRYEKIRDIWETLASGRKLSIFQQEWAKGLLGASDVTEEEAFRQLTDAKGDVDGLTKSIEELNASLRKGRNAVIELGAASQVLSFEQELNRAQDAAALLQAETEGLGRNWELSTTRLQVLNRELAVHEERLARNAYLVMLGLGTPQMVDQMREDAKAVVGLRGDISGVGRGRDAFLRERGLTARSTQRGWFRGSPSEMARNDIAGTLDALQEEMRGLREQYTEDWARGMLDSYEQTMKADAIAQPWLQARDRIEQSFTDAFVSIFSQAQNGAVDLGDAFQSVIASFQSQYISQWVRKHLHGMFDQLATAEVGYSPAEFGISTSAKAASLSLDGLSINAQAAAASLGLIAGEGAAGGLGIGGLVGGGIAQGVSEGVQDAAEKAGKSSRPSNSSMAGLFGNYSMGSMFAGPIGSMLGYEPESAAMYGGLGYAAGMALGLGPIGAIALGLGGIFGFGKKKKKREDPAQDPRRDIYGMPAFEWESYLYNLYKNDKQISAYALGSDSNVRLMESAPIVNQKNIGSVTVNIHSDDPHRVAKTVRQVLNAEFGPISTATAGMPVSL